MTVTYGSAAAPNTQPNYQDAINIANQLSNQIAQMAGQCSAASQHEIVYNILYNKNLHVRNLKDILTIFTLQTTFSMRFAMFLNIL